MPTRTKQQEDEIIAEAIAQHPPLIRDEFPAVIPDPDGFYHSAQYIRIECDWPGLAPLEGCAPLWAELNATLTFADSEQIPDPWQTTFGELYRYVCPHVRAWNARGIDRESGELRPVPPPAEIGPDAFRVVRPLILVWLAFTLKTLHLGGGPNRGKETQESSPG